MLKKQATTIELILSAQVRPLLRSTKANLLCILTKVVPGDPPVNVVFSPELFEKTAPSLFEKIKDFSSHSKSKLKEVIKPSKYIWLSTIDVCNLFHFLCVACFLKLVPRICFLLFNINI
jgi:hypothetical protein